MRDRRRGDGDLARAWTGEKPRDPCTGWTSLSACFPKPDHDNYLRNATFLLDELLLDGVLSESRNDYQAIAIMVMACDNEDATIDHALRAYLGTVASRYVYLPSSFRYILIVLYKLVFDSLRQNWNSSEYLNISARLSTEG
ncbi:hypothetical protein M8818_007201 [Zalaria obscura]|uniref:Uncharacterized protein n=1 Tax=Zalaria obscura TaxID=2024903 RepID=A0ACC3S651_9PEZI